MCKSIARTVARDRAVGQEHFRQGFGFRTHGEAGNIGHCLQSQLGGTSVAGAAFLDDQRRNIDIETASLVLPSLGCNCLPISRDQVPARPCHEITHDRGLDVDGVPHGWDVRRPALSCEPSTPDGKHPGRIDSSKFRDVEKIQKMAPIPSRSVELPEVLYVPEVLPGSPPRKSSPTSLVRLDLLINCHCPPPCSSDCGPPDRRFTDS